GIRRVGTYLAATRQQARQAIDQTEVLARACATAVVANGHLCGIKSYLDAALYTNKRVACSLKAPRRRVKGCQQRRAGLYASSPSLLTSIVYRSHFDGF